jgi:3-oxoacyl-[acyl-carrier protein] reductase
MARLEHKAALVTGASRGIGRAIAERLAADGADVVIGYVSDAGAAAQVVAAITAAGGRGHAVQADLGSAESARQLFDEAEKAIGPLDILVNNAGSAPVSLIADTSDEVFDSAMAINVRAPFVLLREAATRLRDGGRIVNISTLNTILVGPGLAAYAASKAALELLSRIASYEFGGRGITVNSVLPGATDTDLFRLRNPPGEGWERIAARTSLGRIGQPADVADVVALLVSEEGRWMTGQSIRADGGLA